MEHGPPHTKAIIDGIDKTLAEEEVRSAILHEAAQGDFQAKLDALNDFEAVVWYRVGQGEMTYDEAEDAFDLYIRWLEGDVSGYT